MSSNKYTLSFTSRRIYFVKGFLTIAFGLLITLFIATSIKGRLSEMAFLGIDIFFTVLLFYLTRGWHKGQLKICFKENEMTVSSYLPILRQTRQYNFLWKDISTLCFSDTQYFKVLIVKTKIVRVTVALNYGDEVNQLENFLNKKISKLNQNDLLSIPKKPSIYETKGGFLMAIALVFLMIGWPIAAWLNDKEFKIGLAFIFYSGAGFFIYMVYQHRKSKKLD